MSAPTTHDAEDSLDAQVRRGDSDRWLASRFVADPAARATVTAIYALDLELARVAAQVTTPLAGEIRLAWWRERLEAMAEGVTPPGQPVLQALAPAVASGRLPLALFDAMIEARHADLDAEPFADDAALARYLDGVFGAVTGLAARALDPEAPLRAVVEAGRAWGLAMLFRAHLADRLSRPPAPTNWGAPDAAALAMRVRAEVDAALVRARGELDALPVAAFPAVAYVALARTYARGRTPGELERRVRLLRATVSGRV